MKHCPLSLTLHPHTSTYPKYPQLSEHNSVENKTKKIFITWKATSSFYASDVSFGLCELFTSHKMGTFLLKDCFSTFNTILDILKCRRWGMPTHSIKVEHCRAGFKSDEKVSCSIFYPSKNALFSEGTMNAEIYSCLRRTSKIFRGSWPLVRCMYVWWVWPIGNHHNMQAPEFLCKELLI